MEIFLLFAFVLVFLAIILRSSGTNRELEITREYATRLEESIQQDRKERWSLLLQNQDLAQQLATLRVEKGASPDERKFIAQEEAKPYSDDLKRFLDGIINAEARRLCEEEIELQRARGIEDSQILQYLSEGEEIG